MKPFQLRHMVGAATAMLSLPAFAHDSHGNTPLHAVLHMLEQNGAVIGLLLVAGIAMIGWRVQQQRSINKRVRNQQTQQENTRDSR